MALDTGIAKAETAPRVGAAPARSGAGDAPEQARWRKGGAAMGAALGASARELRHLRRRFPSLAWRIVLINIIGLAVLMGGVLYLNQLRNGMIDIHKQLLARHAGTLATAIAESAAEPGMPPRYDYIAANEALRRLSLPSGMRVQLYDRGGRLTGDTRALIEAQRSVQAQILPPIAAPGGVLGWIETLYGRVARAVLRERPEPYNEIAVAGITFAPEVYAAMRRGLGASQRINSEDELILSVAVPIQQVHGVMGALVLSTEGGDIDNVIALGRVEILRIFIIGALVSILISAIFAATVARPIRRLAQAAEEGGAKEGGALNPTRIKIPDFTRRGDEIGDLSGALKRMTDALYRRIDAIESFAADVAHEIKNPLTSLRSAVETMRLAKKPEARERLLEVIEHDVQRLDRLVTDISNASRLDAELVREAKESFDLKALVETVVDITSGDAKALSARIETILPPGDLPMHGMESRIGQVLRNLIENALSFSPEGGVVKIYARREGGEHPIMRIDVVDQGPGVPPDNLSSIFERFYTERPEAESFGEHSGLGLSISRQIVEAHDGAIWAENIMPDDGSDTPIGARFVVRLPA